MGSLLRLASLNWSSLRRHNSTPPGSLITHSAVSASNCSTTSFPRLTAPTYILPWYSPILPQRSTRLARSRPPGRPALHPRPNAPAPTPRVESARMGQAWVRLQAGLERAVGVRLALHLVLLVQPALQLRRVVATVRLCPILGQSLAPLHHAVVLRPPRRVPDHPDVQPHQPQGKGRREIAARSPGIAVVHPQRHRSTPLPEAAAQLGLHHSGGHLGEVALGGKHSCSRCPRAFINHPKPANHPAIGQAFLVGGIDLPRVVRVLGPLPTPALRPTGWGRSQVMPASRRGWSARRGVRPERSSSSVRRGCGRRPSGDVDGATRGWIPATAELRVGAVHSRDSGAVTQRQCVRAPPAGDAVSGRGPCSREG